MPEWLGIVLMVHGLGTVLILLFGWVELSTPFVGWEERRPIARVMLASPLWLPVGIVYGIYRLIQIARTGE